MKVARIISVLIVLLLSVDCAKFSPECEFVIKPRLRRMSMDKPGSPAYMVRVYAFYNIGKTRSLAEKWRPRSFAEAEAGIINRRGSDEVRSYSLVGEQGEDTFVHLTMTSSPVMLVAVDPLNRFYAYGVFEYEIPLPRLEIVLPINGWLDKEPYKEAYWTVINEKYDREGTPETEEKTQ